MFEFDFRMVFMNAFEKLIYFLQAEADTPQMYGGFHIVFLLLAVALAILFSRLVFLHGDKVYRRIILSFWIIMVVSEIYRELVFSMDATSGVAVWDYAWYQFPFQLCATPLYVFPLVALLPDGAVRDACRAYAATFALFGGIAVMLYPGDVLCSYIGINIQSLVHHGLQLVGGVVSAVSLREKYDLKQFLKGVIVFCAFVTVAMTLNIGVHAYHISAGMDDTFNMFFISPYFDCTLPVLSSVYKLVPYPLFLLVYVIGFALVALLIFGITKLVQNSKSKFEYLWKKARQA